MQIYPEQYVCRAEGKISTELDGETVILDMESGEYLGLDEVGTCVWQNLEEKITVKGLVAIVHGEFDVAEEVCLADLQSFLSDLAENKLIYLSDQ